MSKERQKNIKNLSDMVSDLDEVEVTLPDLKKLGLSIMLDAKEEKTRVDVLKALIDIEIKLGKTSKNDNSEIINLLEDDK